MDADAYLRQTIRAAMSAPILPLEKEQELARSWRDEEDESALSELIESHMRMAVSTAIKFRGYGLPLGDMVQEGAIGLLEAARRFDPDREVRFSTYAGWWIRASMQDYILRNWSIVRVGSKSAHKTIFFNLSRIRQLIEDVDREPRIGVQKAAERFRVTEDDVIFMTSRLGRRDQSLNAPLTDDSGMERQELIEDERALQDETVASSIDGGKLTIWLQGALDDLNARERLIIEQRFFGEEKVTLSRLGVELNLSKERVRQIEKQAMKKLKKGLGDSLPVAEM